MGLWGSKIQNIDKELLETIETYKFWNNPKICDNLEIFYTDKLVQLDNSQLSNITTKIGLTTKENQYVDKDKLCKLIIENYKSKLSILQIIYNSLVNNREKIEKAGHGNICLHSKDYIKDFFKCQENKGLWISSNQYSNLLKTLKNKKIYVKKNNKFKKEYTNYFNKLQKIFITLKKDINNSLTIKQLEDIYTKTSEITNKMDSTCNQFFLDTVNIVYNQ